MIQMICFYGNLKELYQLNVSWVWNAYYHTLFRFVLRYQKSTGIMFYIKDCNMIISSMSLLFCCKLAVNYKCNFIWFKIRVCMLLKFSLSGLYHWGLSNISSNAKTCSSTLYLPFLEFNKIWRNSYLLLLW